jgi:RNA polymerase sigma factor (sigma-70 family)
VIYPAPFALCRRGFLFNFTEPSLLVTALSFIVRLFKSPPTAPPTEAELLLRYRASGDLQALGDLYERYLHLVYGVAMKYLKDPDQAKDVTMQLFEKLVTALREHEVRDFASWLHTTAKNHCLGQLRAQQRHPQQPLPQLNRPPGAENDEGVMENGWSEHPVDADEREAQLTQMETGLTHLPPEQQTCLDLFYLQEKSYKEIAEITGFELNKVKSYIQNGKRNLRIYLEKHHGD